MLVKGIVLILIGSLIGWITNYIAIKMLFKPYEEINFIFFKIQGLIPKRRHEIGEIIAETVQKELISLDDIKEKLSGSSIDEEIGTVVKEMLDNNLHKMIATKFPMLAMFLNADAIETIKNSITDLILENKEQVLDMFVGVLEKNIDFKQIIVEKVDAFSLEELERITFTLAKKELKHIEVIGAILGGIIGAVQFGIMLFM